MPYKSKKQAAWMHKNKPKLAKKWDKKYDSVQEQAVKQATKG